MRNPEKNIPRAIHTSMVVVVVRMFPFVENIIILTLGQLLFMLTNISYFVVLDKVSFRVFRRCYHSHDHCPWQATVGLSNTVALDFGRAIFGPIGGSIFAILVAISCFGALNGWCFPTPIISVTKSLSARLPYQALSSRLLV